MGEQENEAVNRSIREQLARQGHVVDYPVDARSHHHFTRIWQFFDAPTPFSVHLSTLGVGLSLKSNNDAAAKALLTPEQKDRELRRVWAIEARGELSGEDVLRLLKLGHRLRDGVISAGANWQGLKVFKVAFLEGR